MQYDGGRQRAGWAGMRTAGRQARLFDLAVRVGGFGLLWLALTGEPDSWPYGLLAVFIACSASLVLLPPRRRVFRPLELISLVPVIVWYSLVGGGDVALRALRPSRPLDPALIEIPLPDNSDATAIALAYVLTLMPGTLVAAFTERGLVVHVVDRKRENQSMAIKLERSLRAALSTGVSARHD